MPSLLTAVHPTDEIHLLIGSSGITSTRLDHIIHAGAHAILIEKSTNVSAALKRTIDKHEKSQLFTWIDREFDLSDLVTLGRQEVDYVVDRVFSNARDNVTRHSIYNQCRKLRIPVNTADHSELSSFSLMATYRDGPFQVGVTTNGKGCRLASRIKRELVASLPADIGDICENVGQLRRAIQKQDEESLMSQYADEYIEWQKYAGEHEEDAEQNSKFNQFISEFGMSDDQKKQSRGRWLSQVVEYYPLSTLGKLQVDDLKTAYTSEPNSQIPADKSGSISLVGAGPGSVSMLSVGALREICTADLVLADKLVPQQVLALIPSKTETFIARKFPGNAEAAQEELLSIGLQAVKEGRKVVRLKQGDPYIFGRGGEEYLYFSEHGYKPKVLPGITSALASTVVTDIPATQRDVADQVLICTGTGRRGALPVMPEYVETRTTIFLMSLHRAHDLVENLRNAGWDTDVPAAIIERASCPDQRVTRTLLKYIPEVVEEIGSRPPGLLVLGKAVTALKPCSFSDENKYTVEEGFSEVENALASVGQLVHV